MNSKKEKIERRNTISGIVVVSLIVLVGLYFIFDVNKKDNYDSTVDSYDVKVRTSSNSDNETVYYPEYYFKVEGNTYICKTNFGSSKEKYNKVEKIYFDSNNPGNCTTDDEKKSFKGLGILFIIFGCFLYFAIFIGNKKKIEKQNQQFEDRMKNEINEMNKKCTNENNDMYSNNYVKDGTKEPWRILILIIVILLIAYLILKSVFGFKSNNKDKIENLVSVLTEICDISWTRNTDIDSETIRFGCDNSFSYFYGVGDPVEDSDLCENYTYEDGSIKLICDGSRYNNKIEIISYDDNKINLLINNEERSFEKVIYDDLDIEE